MSLLGADGPDLMTALQAAGINLLWHPSLSQASGGEVLNLFERIEADDIPLDIFCLEGSVMRGPQGTGLFHRLAGTGEPTKNLIERLAMKARHVVAIGSCAAYGGITAAGANEVEACGLVYDGLDGGGLLGGKFRARSGERVVNIAGCPVHPGWVTETLHELAQERSHAIELDDFGRPLSYARHLVHHGCSRNEFYEYKASAEQLSDRGCMMENLGCKGTQARADCNIRPWNGSGSCIDGGYPCINCTAPRFEEPNHIFTETPKIAGIPIGLPTDMPKAWFVALAALSKAATPARLRKNAVSDRLVIPPEETGKRSR